MNKNEIDKYVIGTKTYLVGYISTSENPKVAQHFALNEVITDRVPVIFEIDFRGVYGLFKMSEGYSAYPEEAEVLIQDGLEYMVTGNTEEEHESSGQKYRSIKLQYPAD